MKKTSLLFVVMLIAVSSVYAQSDWRLGVNAGIPVGEVDDISNFQFGADITYLYDVANVVGLGAMVGYSKFLADNDLGVEDAQFLPIAASGRIGFLRGFYIGADLGYAIGLSDGNDGGVYYRPKVGFNLFGLGLIASYSGVNADGVSFNSINLGLEIGF